MWRIEGAVTIELPLSGAVELGRRLLPEGHTHVSRLQAVLVVSNDRELTIESRGGNPTGLLRSGRTEWEWLAKGSSSPLMDGDQIALDKKRRQGSVLRVVQLGPARWFWKVQGGWKPYLSAQSLLIEQAWESGAPRVDISSEYHVDLTSRVQRRNDDPTKCRAVQRRLMPVVGDVIPPSTQEATPASSEDSQRVSSSMNDDDLVSPPAKRPRSCEEAPGDERASIDTRLSSDTRTSESNSQLGFQPTIPPSQNDVQLGVGQGASSPGARAAPESVSQHSQHDAEALPAVNDHTRREPAWEAAWLVAQRTNQVIDLSSDSDGDSAAVADPGVSSVALPMAECTDASAAASSNAHHTAVEGITVGGGALTGANSAASTPSDAAPPACRQQRGTTTASIVDGGALDSRALVPVPVAKPSGVNWTHAHDALLVCRAHEPPRRKVAGLDLDGTLLRWTCPSWPQKLTDYAMWNHDLPTTLRKLHADGFKLVIFGNRSTIKGAFTGKNAEKTHALVHWLTHTIGAPMHALFATRKPSRFYKPEIGMWEVMEGLLNDGVPVDAGASFYVGDMESDREWATNVGRSRQAHMAFQSPEEAFGLPAGPTSSNREGGGGSGNATSGTGQVNESVSENSLKARAALLGGYMRAPRMVVLVGPQGAGKSFFCAQLLEQAGTCSGTSKWTHINQDTIGKDGKPGKRDVCEQRATEALRRGECVVIDRMHLNPQQRAPFVEIAKAAGVHVDAVVLRPGLAEMQQRVKERTDHPGKVMGPGSVGMVSKSLHSLQAPEYTEGFCLITVVETPEDVRRLTALYQGVVPTSQTGPSSALTVEELRLAGTPRAALSPPLSHSLGAPSIRLPSITLGTYKLRKDAIASMMHAGFRAVDTAPTYENEAAVGAAMAQADHIRRGNAGEAAEMDVLNEYFLVCKVPRRAINAQDVRKELTQSLNKLKRPAADLLLLHWPDQAIENGTLREVWQAMEAALEACECRAIGVCNFSVAALRELLPMCRIRPVVNQIERHPLLPQWRLLEFCWTNRITVQAHTPLAQGRPKLLSHPVVSQIASMNGLTSAQVVIQWNLCHGVAIVAKCSTPEHAVQILDALPAHCITLTSEQMAMLDDLIGLDGKGSSRMVAPPYMLRRQQAGPCGASYAWD